MKKILIAFDKFKDTLTAEQVTEAVYKGLPTSGKHFFIYKIPLADGGEGTADILSSFDNYKKIKITVNNPLFKKVNVKYYYSSENQTAIMDLSEASGLYLLNLTERNPMITSTIGTGEMILDAIKKGAKKIIIGLGGSATNDAAIGAAYALGYKFYDKSGKELIPVGKNLINIFEIDNNNLKINFDEIEITALYDVKNTLYGKTGAAYIYSKQKGAKLYDISILDKGLKNISSIIKQKLGKNVSQLEGGGSAGGFGAGSFAFFNADLKPGSKTILDILNINKFIKECDLIITGEGKFDNQSLQGKVTGELIKRAKRFNKPVAVICGTTKLQTSYFKNDSVKIYPLFKRPFDIGIAKQESVGLIAEKVKMIIDSNQ